MRETLKMMESILTGKEKETDEKELIKEYQEYLSPNILAYFYKVNFGLVIQTNYKYPLLTDEDKASFCLQEMDKCLQNFNLSMHNKFSTYFMHCYKNKLRAEQEAMLQQKRKSIINSIELDDNTNPYNYIPDVEMSDENLILEGYRLKDYEKQQCRLLNMGYSLKEIAKLLKLADITIYTRNQRIKQKILNSDINFA